MLNSRLLTIAPLVAMFIWPAHKPSTVPAVPSQALQESNAVVVPSEMPIAVISARVQSEEGRQLSVLNYAVKNNSNQTIKRFALGAYLVQNNGGKCLRGEVWTVKEDLRPNAIRHFSTPLRNYVDQNGRLAVALVSVADQVIETKTNFPELRKALKQIASTGDATLVSSIAPVGVTTNAAPPPASSCPGFCASARADALNTCLGEGCTLTAFSCNQTACSYSFACRCCDPQGQHCN